jgi:hypothetical protein
MLLQKSVILSEAKDLLKFLSILILLSTGLTSGCRTTGNEDESQILSSAEGFDAVMPLSKDDEQNLYLKMLGVELNNGVKVPKDQLHSIGGVFQCQQDGSLSTCSYRVRVRNELSAHQPFERTWTDKIFGFVKSSRPELATERIVIGDLVCDYVGKKSPPYDMEDVNCFVRYPRKITETVFVEKQAEEMSELLRGDEAYGKQVVKLSGALNCRYVDGSKRAVCVVRAVTGGVLQETLREIQPANATNVAGKLRQGYADYRSLSGAQSPDAMPREMTAALVCSVNNLEVESKGARRYVCSAGF